MSETATKTTCKNEPIDNPEQIEVDFNFSDKRFYVLQLRLFVDCAKDMQNQNIIARISFIFVTL